MSQRILNFFDLRAWQEGRIMTLKIYTLTKSFLKEELFGLTNQIRRAAVSITSNIAEGFSRETMKDKTHFYIIAFGSLNEVYNQAVLARDIGYIRNIEWNKLEEQIIITSKILNGLIKKSIIL
jgi:four helix bundle protein